MMDRIPYTKCNTEQNKCNTENESKQYVNSNNPISNKITEINKMFLFFVKQ